MTVTDSSNDGRGPRAPKTVPQHEIDAQKLREKTARLRELRLAQEAANNTAGARPAAKRAAQPRPKGQRDADAKAKGVSLSQWLAAQQNQGRRN
jgi:hypothetical protein